MACMLLFIYSVPIYMCVCIYVCIFMYVSMCMCTHRCLCTCPLIIDHRSMHCCVIKPFHKGQNDEETFYEDLKSKFI